MVAVLRHLAAQPAGRALVLLAALAALYALYGYTHFYRDPLSVFYSPGHGNDRLYSARRQAEAAAFMNRALASSASGDGDAFQPGRAAANVSICATFITIARKVETQYVDDAVGSFLANMSRAERQAIDLKLFFADVPDPRQQHPSYHLLKDANVADEIYTYNSSLADDSREDTLDRLCKLVKFDWRASDTARGRSIERKSLHDYAHALGHCLDTTDAPYIAILEDDILLAEGWAAKAMSYLADVEAMMKDPSRKKPARGKIQPGTPNTWLYLRLFNQERSYGWSGGTGFFANKVHIISLAVSLPLLALLLLLRWLAPSRRLNRSLDVWTMLVLCCLAVPFWVWMFFASGKASLVGTAPGVHEEWFGCCNQALIYNREHAHALADHLLSYSKRPMGGRGDMITKDFAFNRGLARLSGYPMLAQHVGFGSASDTTLDDARKIWSMEFEELKPSELVSEHWSLVRDMFGDEAASEMRSR